LDGSKPLKEVVQSLLKEYQEAKSNSPVLVDESVIDTVFGDGDETFEKLFLSCLCMAQAVVISRMRKDQKQLITHHLKVYGEKAKDPIHILCIGDGANDIGMIRESDIGVGIKGKEGLQAFNNCDVGVPSFRCLDKLLFVHGKSNEMRLQILVLYFLYKNTLLSMLTLLLSYSTMFSGQRVMPSWGIDFFNT
jgi:phospholipid-translocating ATPase